MIYATDSRKREFGWVREGRGREMKVFTVLAIAEAIGMWSI